MADRQPPVNPVLLALAALLDQNRRARREAERTAKRSA